MGSQVQILFPTKFSLDAGGGWGRLERSKSGRIVGVEQDVRGPQEQSSNALGLIRTLPTQRTRYDATFVLGGTPESNDLRTRAVARLAAAGVDVGKLAFLTADRALTGAELDQTTSGEITEALNVLQLVEQVFGPHRMDGPVTVEGGREARLAGPSGPCSTLLIADPPAGASQAHTIDTIRVAANRPSAWRAPALA
jgi:hypothetical protein